MHKVINDPVHGFITIEDPLILQLIDHPICQRMRNVQQMGMASLVYPGARHSRFLHALGAFHLMGQAIVELQRKGVEITPEEAQASKIAILLHDIGHFPFSHALEQSIIAQVHHEEVSFVLMNELNRIFHSQLDLAIQIFENKYHKSFLHQLISGHLDVDRLDYLVRDSFFTGVAEGIVGIDRILKMIDVHDNQLVILEKGIFSIDKFLMARKVMYGQVYLHKTVWSAEKLLVNILRRAKEIYTTGRDLFVMPELEYFFKRDMNLINFREEKTVQMFLALDDYDLYSHFKQWVTSDDSILSLLSQMLMDRRLYKSKDTKDVVNIKEYEQRVRQLVPHIKEEELNYFIMEDAVDVSLYDTQYSSILILKKDGKIIPLEDIEMSFANQLQNENYSRSLLFYTN